MSTDALPILELIPELLKQLRAQDVLALQAPPGAGKSTECPIHLLADFASTDQRIILLQPRRIAVRNVAHRLAERLGEKPGQRIGYRMRGETKVSSDTLLEVQTEGVFLRLLQNDPALESVSLVMFDEYHERSLDADLCFALCRHSQSLFRDLRDTPLRLLLMSATLDNEGLQSALPDMPWLISEGRQYPVTVHYEADLAKSRPYPYCDLERLKDRVLQALEMHGGNCLVFLPGQAEIRRLQAMLETAVFASNVQIRPLYGALPMSEQQAAIAAPAAGQRKVVLATDIAETSLTIDGIHCVIDSGLARKPVFVARSGLSRLELQQVPRSAADQRAGRAGRLGPGVAYRLWTEEAHQRRARHRNPEIYHSDLSNALLQCIAFGCQDPYELAWVEPPPQAAVTQAFSLLASLGFIDNVEGAARLSKRGQAALKLPLEPRLQALLIAAVEYDCTELGCALALCLEGATSGQQSVIELGDRLKKTQQQIHSGRDRRLHKEYKRLLGLCSDLTSNFTRRSIPENWQLASLCMAAFPDRLARRTGNGSHQYLMVNGRGVQLPASKPDSGELEQADWIVVIDTRAKAQDSRDSITCAVLLPSAILDSELLADRIEQEMELSFDEPKSRFQSRQVRRLGAIELQSQPVSLPPLADAGDSVIAAIRRSGLTFFTQWPAVQAWLSRIRLLRELHDATSPSKEANPWPEWDEQALLASLEEWFLAMLPTVGDWSALKKMDLQAALESQLDWSLLQRLEQEAPTRYRAPSGLSHDIDYSQRPPVVELKLQELFSLTETPSIARGQQRLKLQLLSPAGRPIAVTSDLAHFWQHGYPMVKAEMKGRYPKHPWPDDPATAEPTVLTKRAMAARNS